MQGGGATETGNGIHVSVVSADGGPASFASVQLVRSDTWIRDLAKTGAPRVLTARADAAGKVVFDSLPGSWAVQCDWGSQAGILAVGPGGGSLKLQPVSRLRRFLSGTGSGALRVVGSAWSSRVDSTGTAEMFLPPGSFAMAVRVDSGAVAAGTATIRPWEPLEDSVIVDPKRLILDDFSSSGSLTTFWRFAGFGNWYVVGDSSTRIWSATDPKAASFAGNLSVRYHSADTAYGYAIAGISFVNDAGRHALELSRMDSLCFDARGTGRLSVALQEIVGGLVSHRVSADLGLLAPGWTGHCLTPANFGTGWNGMKSIANDLAFVAGKGDLMEIRSIVLWGVPLQALVP